MSDRADFSIAVDALLVEEGGYSNDPKDRGGETKFGISKRSYPQLDIAGLTRDQAIDIYKRDWWDRFDYGRIANQRVATKLLSLSVNMGSGRAHMLLQQALRAVDLPCKVDGIFGPVTAMAVNVADSRALVAALRSEAAGHYRVLIARTPELARFENGWLTRAYA